MTSPRLAVDLDVAPRVNLALQQNDVPFLRGLELHNPTEAAVGPLRVRITADPPFLLPLELRVDGLGPGARHRVAPVPLALSPTFLARQAEREQGHLTITVTFEDGAELVETRPVEVLAPTEWLGVGVLPELLAAFVRPNAPVLGPVLKDAAERLRVATGDASLSGYQTRDPKRVWAMAQALYEAVQARGTSYINAPASYEVIGQKVRTHEAVLEVGQGTCLDLTVLLAALLEQAGLHPLLLITEGHAFPGVWLSDWALHEPTLDDPLPVRKRVELGEALVFDSSAVATGVPFADAVRVAERELRDTARFRLAIDVHTAREQRIRPLPLERTGEALASAVVEAPGVRVPVAPSAVPEARFRFAEREAPTSSALTRVDRWKQKLLDLSLRNRLLNFRATRTTLALPHADLGALEDTLAAGGAFRLEPKLALKADDPRRVEQGGTLAADALAARAVEQQARGVLSSDLAPAEHEKQLLELWRQSRSAFEESGAILLYVALGLLEWFESPSSTQPRRAPLVLVPVQLERGRSASTWTLRAAEEDTRVNVTLLKKLEADFGLDVRGLDVLPEDEQGFDVERVLHDFRRLVRDRDRWQVLDEAHLGLFSFQKFLMWLDLEAKQDALLQNPVVKHLFAGTAEPFPLAAPLVPDAEVERARAPEDVLTVVDADPSQLSAVLAAEDGSSFVLQGPPGTGKSQTITNLIAQLLARGKTVLFVSEKLAALEVVQRRLEKVGLGPFCLELHSHQASKQAVMTQLKASFDVVGRRDAERWRAHARRLGEARAALNGHAARLAAPSPFGVATREVLASLFGLADVPRLALDDVDLHGLTPDDVTRLAGAARAFVVAAEDAGPLEGHPFRGVGRGDWSPNWARAVEDAGRALAAAARRVEDDRGAVLDLVGLPPSTPLDELVEAARLLVATPAPPTALVQLGGFRDRAVRIGGWVERGRALVARRDALSTRWTDGLLALDLAALRQRVAAWADAFFLVAFFVLWGVRRTLATVARGPVPPNRALVDDLDVAAWVRDEAAALDAVGADAERLLGAAWQGTTTDWDAVGRLVGWAERLHRLVLATVDRTGDPAAAERLIRLGTEHAELVAPGTRASATLSGFVRDVDAFVAARSHAVALLQLDEGEAFGDDDGPAHVATVADGWVAGGPRLRTWCGLVEATRGMEAVGLRPVVDAVLDGTITVAAVDRTVTRSLREGWWEALLEREPALRAFRGASHGDAIARFRELDRAALTLARQEVVARLAERAPDLHAPGDEMGLLKRQMMLQRKHLPIRQLFARIPTTLRRLKPCTLMSPLSVAQYLDPSLPGFDVVVFDEASQIPPWDAVGAIARGRQVVVVGDSRQLPPTSFFARGADDEEGVLDEEDVEETESILDEMVAARLRELSLKWHYRSRHESLIAFSNAHYYENRLYTFPSSAEDVPELGVKLVKVKGFYDRGGSRTNRAEAEAVVAELVRLLRLPDAERPSVGVLTFSQAQQRLVEDLVDVQRQAHPELDRFFTDAVPEPVFVKNLENVQGDERDVMLFSICYGPDAAGRTTINFGPLNKKGGERRLNVAVTRARRRLVVYATLDWGQIDLNRTPSTGVAHLKAFLRYAEQGPSSLLSTTTTTDRDTFMSPFEEQVHAALTRAGWQVHTQVGCSGYRIDLGVVDPDRPGTYLLGVECDGATYHGSRSARERDRLREDVLVSLGWRIQRVWSTDWWYDRAAQIEKLLAAVDAAREQARLGPAVASTPPEPTLPRPVRPPTVEERLATAPVVRWPDDAAPWRAPSLPTVSRAKEAFYEPPSRGRLAAALLQVVRESGPVHRDVAYRTVAGAWGLGSLGRRIVATLDDALAALPPAERPVDRGDFLWPAGVSPQAWRGFRYVDGADARGLDEVPPEEIANAAAWVLARAVSIAQVELVREAARVFGSKNVTSKASARVLEALPELERTGRGQRRDDRWTWVG